MRGPTVVQVPWARHGAAHTRAFDDTVAWLAVQFSTSAVCELMRIAWGTVMHRSSAFVATNAEATVHREV